MCLLLWVVILSPPPEQAAHWFLLKMTMFLFLTFFYSKLFPCSSLVQHTFQPQILIQCKLFFFSNFKYQTMDLWEKLAFIHLMYVFNVKTNKQIGYWIMFRSIAVDWTVLSNINQLEMISMTFLCSKYCFVRFILVCW